MGILYFYETAEPTFTRETVEKLRLSYAFESFPTARQADNGPGGHGGFTFGAGIEDKDVRFKPDAQIWERFPVAPASDAGGNSDNKDASSAPSRLWLGYWKNKRPTPESLARREMISGHYVELCDGNKWLIPVARQFDGNTLLPKLYKYNGSEWLLSGIEEKYQELWNRACTYFEQFKDSLISADDKKAEMTLTLKDEVETAVMALSMNYMVGPVEISSLQLLNTDSAMEIALALVDWPVIKKKLEEASDSSAGKEN